MLINLIENTDKYSPPKALVQVALAFDVDRSICISVTDQRIGIPPDVLPKIFERFHRGRNVMHLQQGAGLGLLVVKLFVETMGGRISLESSVGEGSAFRVHLLVFRGPPP